MDFFFGSEDIEELENNHVRRTTITYSNLNNNLCTTPKEKHLKTSCIKVPQGLERMKICGGYALGSNSISFDSGCSILSIENNMSKKTISYKLTYDSETHKLCGVYRGDKSESFQCRDVRKTEKSFYLCNGHIRKKKHNGCIEQVIKSKHIVYDCYGRYLTQKNKEKNCKAISPPPWEAGKKVYLSYDVTGVSES